MLTEHHLHPSVYPDRVHTPPPLNQSMNFSNGRHFEGLKHLWIYIYIYLYIFCTNKRLDLKGKSEKNVKQWN